MNYRIGEEYILEDEGLPLIWNGEEFLEIGEEWERKEKSKKGRRRRKKRGDYEESF